MTKAQRREDIGDRFSKVSAERSLQQNGSEAWISLSEILWLIHKEYQNGSSMRHVMYYRDGRYGYTIEAF